MKPKTPVKLPEKAEVRITIETDEPSRTPLGKDLRALRARALAEGPPALDYEGVLEDVRARRSGFRE